MAEPVLTQDMHVYSTFSDGRNTIEWVPAYVAAIRGSRKRTPIVLRCAVEAKILDIYGRLDLPAELDGIDAVYAASHQAPSPDGPMNPRSTRERIEAGELDRRMVLRWIVSGTIAAVRHHEHLVIVHLFSVLPGLGLDERDVSADRILRRRLARAPTPVSCAGLSGPCV
jgi:hypothetical protein